MTRKLTQTGSPKQTQNRPQIDPNRPQQTLTGPHLLKFMSFMWAPLWDPPLVSPYDPPFGPPFGPLIGPPSGPPFGPPYGTPDAFSQSVKDEMP